MAIWFNAKRRVVRDMIVMRSERGLEQTPSLVNAEHGNEVRSGRSGVVTATKRAEAGSTKTCYRRDWDIIDASLIVRHLVLRRYRAANAVAKVSSVAELVHTGDRAATTNKTVVVVAGIVGPRSAELRDCLTHREASELDEGVVDTKCTAGDLATAR